jgi:hypothetical protein
MTPNPNQVVVASEGEGSTSVSGFVVHHRDFPEVRGEGRSAEDAAERLVEHLSRTLDNAPSVWRRDLIERAIGDVRAFVTRDLP